MKYKDVELKNLHVALGAGLIFGVGVFMGWLLTAWGVFACNVGL
jgi:hypothetical protein